MACAGIWTRPVEAEKLFFALEIEDGDHVVARPQLVGEVGKRLTLKEIADIQGGTVAALKVRLHRGRKRLAEILRADYSEEREGQPQPPEEEAEKEKKRRHRNNPDIKSRTTLP